MKRNRSAANCLGPIVRAAVLCVLGCSTVQACQLTKRDDDINAGRILLSQQPQQDVQLHTLSNGQNGLLFERCASNASVDVEVSWNAPGLAYVRDVSFGGLMFPAYGWHASSPLVIFQAYKISSGAAAGTDRTPLRPGQLNRFAVRTGIGANTRMSFSLMMVFFSRGGEMLDVPPQNFSATTRFPGLFGAPTFSHQQTFELAFPQRTCSLTNQTLALKAVSASALQNPGDTTPPEPLSVAMNCPAAGINVLLTLTDAESPGNRSEMLTPPASASATGVAIQLLRQGRAVTLGTQWTHGISAAGMQSIPLAAHYIRLASPLTPGATGGRAVLTADYR